MKNKGAAYTVDKFHPMVTKELKLLPEFVWKAIHDLNGSKNTFPIIKQPSYNDIRKELKAKTQEYIYFYRKHPDLNEIYLHSEHLRWNMVRLEYSSLGEYSYQVLFIN